MQIQPAGSYPTAGILGAAPQATAKGGSIAAATSDTLSLTSTSTMLQATMVNQQISGMLSQIDPSLANDQMLKLLIAALIFNTLLNNDGDAQEMAQGTLQALEQLAGGRQNALYFSMESSTNTVQFQQQSVRLDTTQAIQLITETGAQNGQQGTQLDISG